MEGRGTVMLRRAMRGIAAIAKPGTRNSDPSQGLTPEQVFERQNQLP